MKKQILGFVGAVALFLVLAYGFVPQVLSGKIVNQSDISGYIGMSHEMTEWNKAHPDDPTAWTDAMFGGMPPSAPRARVTGRSRSMISCSPANGRPPICSFRCWAPSCSC